MKRTFFLGSLLLVPGGDVVASPENSFPKNRGTHTHTHSHTSFFFLMAYLAELKFTHHHIHLIQPKGKSSPCLCKYV